MGEKYDDDDDCEWNYYGEPYERIRPQLRLSDAIKGGWPPADYSQMLRWNDGGADLYSRSLGGAVDSVQWTRTDTEGLIRGIGTGRDAQLARGTDGWTLSGSEPGARALIRNNVVVLLAPFDGAANATYQIRTASNGTRDTQPREPAPFRGTIAVAPVPGVESPQQFLDAFSTAITGRDAAFLSSRLHPAVIARYGKDACDAYTSSALTPVQFVVTDVGPPTSFAWTTDGQTTNVPDTNDVSVRQIAGGTTQDRVIHIARVEGTWRWFTDCTPA